MRRVTGRLQRLTFEALLCGTQEELPHPSRLAAACAQATEDFASQCSTSAPPPSKLATAVVASHLLSNSLVDAAAVLACHPQQREILNEVQQYTAKHPDAFSVSTLISMAEMTGSVGSGAKAAFLRAAAQQLHSSRPVSPTEDAAGSAWEAQRESLRDAVMRHTRLHPTTASSLLGCLCSLSTSTAEHCADVVDTMQTAMKQRSLNPRDLASVLTVVQKAGDPQSVAMMWGWMRHTSACWDVRAASAALAAFSELRQLDEAVQCMQKLAEAHCDPTTEAQVAFVRFLGLRVPTLPQYAAQLVEHWHPSPERRWRGEAQTVALELLLTWCRLGSVDEAVAMLEEAVAANADAPAELETLMQRPGAASVSACCGAAVATSAALRELLIAVPLRLPTLAEQPALIGSLLSASMAADCLPDTYAALERSPMTAVVLRSALQHFTGTDVAKAAAPAALLACVREVAARTGHDVPKEMESWLLLATEL